MKRYNPMLVGRRTGIAPANLQSHLDSASNAGAKGQAQYATPIEWAEALALPLPRYRNTLVDLTCGNGSLLAGAARGSGTAHHLLGCDIENAPEADLANTGGASVPASRSPSTINSQPSTSPGTASVPASRPSSALPLVPIRLPPFACPTSHSALASLADNRVVADLTAFYPLLCEGQFEADIFTLNPPWDLHWYRERLAKLADSDCPAVRVAFAAHDGRTAEGTIDSTIATLCVALDRCSIYGEGVLIGNDATLERLLFAPNAPHSALAAHVWARLSIDGNICSGDGGGASVPASRPSSQTQDPIPHPPSSALRTPHSTFRTGVLYFARGHTHGPAVDTSAQSDPSGGGASVLASLEEARHACHAIEGRRHEWRNGPSPKSYAHTKEAAENWAACAEEWRIRQAQTRQSDNPWNLWLDPDGCIATNLSVFDERASQVKKKEAAALHDLKGRHPMQLVLQKNQRKQLERATFGGVWRVSPALREAVDNALKEYDAVRSPLYPLNKIQRLGYLDDNDDILCIRGFGPFKAGQRYPIKTETLRTKRSGEKMNLTGELDEVEWEGSELAIYIADHLFMDVRLRESNVRLSIQDEKAPSPIEFTLQELVEHFEIPDVPDVATRNPEGYNRNLKLLEEIEQLVNA